MNEKELLKTVSDKEYGSRGSQLTAAEVLGTSVSSKARVKGGYWKIGIAAVGAAALAVGAVWVLNKRDVPKDDNTSVRAETLSDRVSALPQIDGETRSELAACLEAEGIDNADLARAEEVYALELCDEFLASGSLDKAVSAEPFYILPTDDGGEIFLSRDENGSIRKDSGTQYDPPAAAQFLYGFNRNAAERLLGTVPDAAGVRLLYDGWDGALLVSFTSGGEQYYIPYFAIYSTDDDRIKECVGKIVRGQELLDIMRVRYAVMNNETNRTAETADIPYYEYVLQKMKKSPENYMVYVEDRWYEGREWKKNGEMQTGVYHQAYGCNYILLPDKDGAYTVLQELDPTPVHILLDLAYAHQSEWQTSFSDTAFSYIYGSDPENVKDTPPMIVFEDASSLTKENGNDEDTVCYTLTHKSGNVWTAAIMFVPHSGSRPDINTITFDITRENGGEYLFDEAGNPCLPSRYVTGRGDEILAGADAESVEYTCVDDENNIHTYITAEIDRENKRVTVITETWGSTELDAPLTVKGAVCVPQVRGYTETENDPSLRITGCKLDGTDLSLDDRLICILPNVVPDNTETFTEAGRVRHEYELTFEGDMSELTTLSLGSIYDTVPDPTEDGLPTHYTGGVVIRLK